MSLEIIPVGIHGLKDRGVLLLFQFERQYGDSKINHLREFQIFKKTEACLEKSWEIVLVKDDFPIGTCSIHNLYQEPESLFFLKINVEEQYFDDELKKELYQWMSRQSKDLGFNRLISYTSKDFIEDFLNEIGGKTVNWLHFFQLKVDNIDRELLEIWDDPMLLQEHNLNLNYYRMIPETLMQRHAELHTQLSNEIQRMDYSWEVHKTADYTRNSQDLLLLRGKKAEIAYLFDKREKIVGMTKIVYDPDIPDIPDIMYQTITGISKNYRGLGLAKLLKANMIRRILNYFPKVTSIETDCLKGNNPMILINEKIGFRRKRNQVEKEIILEELFL